MHFLSIAFLAFLINNISAYETCYSNSYITIYCEDGYKCCSDNYYYDYWSKYYDFIIKKILLGAVSHQLIHVVIIICNAKWLLG